MRLSRRIQLSIYKVNKNYQEILYTTILRRVKGGEGTVREGGKKIKLDGTD